MLERGPVVLTLPSDPDLLALVHAATFEVAAQAGMDEFTAERLVLAVGEVATNAMVHGNGRRPERSVEVRFSVGEGRLEVAVADTGPGFDLADLQGWQAAAREGRPPLPGEGGRGLLLARACVDELKNSRGDAGHRVLLVKKLPTVRAGGGGWC